MQVEVDENACKSANKFGGHGLSCFVDFALKIFYFLNFFCSKSFSEFALMHK